MKKFKVTYEWQEDVLDEDELIDFANEVYDGDSCCIDIVTTIRTVDDAIEILKNKNFKIEEVIK